MSSESDPGARQAISSNSNVKIRAIPRPSDLDAAIRSQRHSHLEQRPANEPTTEAPTSSTSHAPSLSHRALAIELSDISPILSRAFKAWRVKAEVTSFGADRAARSALPQGPTMRQGQLGSSVAPNGESASPWIASRVKALTDGIEELDDLLDCLRPLDEMSEDQNLDRLQILTKVYIHRKERELESRIGKSVSDDRRLTGSSDAPIGPKPSSTTTRASQPISASSGVDASELLQSAIDDADIYLKALEQDDGLGEVPRAEPALQLWIQNFDTEAYSEEVRTLQRGLQEKRASLIDTPAFTITVETV